MAQRDGYAVIPSGWRVRPSQLIYAYGVGSLVELPNFSVLIRGLDDWDQTAQAVISEERLLVRSGAHTWSHRQALSGALREPHLTTSVPPSR